MPVDSKQKKCSHETCKKKLQLTDHIIGPCKCDGVHCQLHRFPNLHNCSFDWHTHQKDLLEIELNNGKCIGEKIESC